MNSHTATINPGTYNSAIGTTTLKALCNDAEGFAIYAIGYTNNEDGNNTLTSTTLPTTVAINTGTALSGNSQWAMKLATDSSATYPVTIQNSFDSFHTVPDDYALVAKRLSSTDIGASAVGSVLTTTYQAYISSTQNADTYVGKVKYVMVHPNDGDAPVKPDQVAVVFNGNGSTFSGGANKNRVVYQQNSCDYYYISDTYEGEAMTSNILPGGEPNGSYTNEENVLESFSFDGAVKIKMVVDYGTTGDTVEMIPIPDTWDGDWDNWDSEWEGYEDESGEWHSKWIYFDDNASGTETYFIDGDTVTIFIESWDSPESGYDYGFYVRLYPFYDEETEGTTRGGTIPGSCVYVNQNGIYSATSNGIGTWSIDVDGRPLSFRSENEVLDYISEHETSLLGTTLNIFAPFVMQNVSEWEDSIANGQETLAYDARDNKIYHVAKLTTDDSIWMMQNLDLDIDSTKTYTSADTDLPSGTTWAPSLSTYATGTTTWSGTSALPESYDPGDLYWDNNNSETVSTGENRFHLGNYYNWTAAVAMNNTYGLFEDHVQNNTSSISINAVMNDYTLVNQSICPAGWTLPRVGLLEDTMEELGADYYLPEIMTLSGIWYGNYANTGSGYYSSAIAKFYDSTYHPLLTSNGRVVTSNISRSSGLNIRCLSRPVTNEIFIK